LVCAKGMSVKISTEKTKNHAVGRARWGEKRAKKFHAQDGEQTQVKARFCARGVRGVGWGNKNKNTVPRGEKPQNMGKKTETPIQRTEGTGPPGTDGNNPKNYLKGNQESQGEEVGNYSGEGEKKQTR